MEERPFEVLERRGDAFLGGCWERQLCFGDDCTTYGMARATTAPATAKVRAKDTVNSWQESS